MIPRRLPRRRGGRLVPVVLILALVVGFIIGTYWFDHHGLSDWQSACRHEAGTPQIVVHDYDYYRKSYVYQWVCTGPSGLIISRHTSYSK